MVVEICYGCGAMLDANPHDCPNKADRLRYPMSEPGERTLLELLAMLAALKGFDASATLEIRKRPEGFSAQARMGCEVLETAFHPDRLTLACRLVDWINEEARANLKKAKPKRPGRWTLEGKPGNPDRPVIVEATSPDAEETTTYWAENYRVLYVAVAADFILDDVAAVSFIDAAASRRAVGSFFACPR